MKRLLVLATIASFLAVGCGGGGGGGSSTPTTPAKKTTTISGIVTDPAISGAQVEIRLVSSGSILNVCGASSNTLCRTFSGDDGIFTFTLPEGYDADLYYLATHGGEDTVTGVSFEALTLKTPLAVFAGNDDNIVVSPLTTLVSNRLFPGRMGTGKSGKISATELSSAVQAVKTSLALGSDANIFADPTADAELFRKSYLVVKIALAYEDMKNTYGKGSDDAFSAIVSAVNSGIIDGTVFKAGALDAIFADFTAEPTYTAAANNLTSTLAVVNSVTGTGNIVDALVTAEKSAMFKTILLDLINNASDTPAALFNTNAESLLSALETAGGSLPLDSLVISQALRYVVFNNSYFADYDNYLLAGFAGELSSLTSASGFAAAVAGIIQDSKVNVVSVPLAADALLGNDNAKRAAYYFNSNIDINYKARKLIASIYSDSVNDSIYLTVVYSYASMGLLDKALKIADSYIVSSYSKARAYYYTAKFMTKFGKTEAEAYSLLKEAEDIVVGIYTARGDGLMTSNEASHLVYLSSEYAYINKLSESERLKNWLESEMNKITNVTTKRTVFGRLLTAQRGVCQSLLASGSSMTESSLEYYVHLIDNQPANTTANTKYSIHLVYYASAVEMYQELGLKAEVKDLFYNHIEPKKEIDRAAAGVQWQLYYDTILAALYWAGDQSQAFAIADTLTTATAINWTAEAIAKIMARTDFDAAVSYYESKVPMDADYANISDYMDAWGYLGVNKLNTGVASQAIADGDDEVAIKALKYIEAKVDAAKAYADANSINYAEYLADVVAGSSSRSYEAGYAKLADMYISMGDTVSATALLVKAEAFTDMVGASLAKAYAYGVIGEYYKKLGNTTAMASVLSKASSLATTDFTETNLSDYYSGLAQDALLAGDKNAAEANIDSAVAHAKLIHASGAVDDTNAKTEVSKLYQLAELYAQVPNLTKTISTLKSAVDTAIQIAQASSRTSYCGYVIQTYAELGLVELAFANAGQLMTTTTDYYDAVLDIASYVTAIDDFPATDVAFIDTDKDGKPDFFRPGATAEEIAKSGLVLDDDIDGDGILDTEDRTPFFAN